VTIKTTRHCGNWNGDHLKRRLVLVAVGVAIVSLLSAQSPVNAIDVRFRFTIGGRPVESGKLWLFYYGWGYRETYTVGEIRNGLVRVRMSDEIVRNEIKPGNMDGFALIVEVPKVGWYRTADLGNFVADTVSALDHLGTGQIRDGLHVVDLPAPAKQRVRALNQDGSPRAGLQLRFEMYVTEANHCGVHEGFDDWREVVTDRNGNAEFVAPIYPLFLAGDFYEETMQPFGRVLERKAGEAIAAGTEHVLRHVWERAPERSFQIHVRNIDGSPGGGKLYAREGYGCDADTEPLASADSHGDIAARFAIEHATELFLARDDREPRAEDALSDAERGQLNRSGQLTIVWPRSSK